MRMPSPEWIKVENEAARISGLDLMSLARGKRIEDHVWRAPRLAVDVYKRSFDEGALAAMQAFAHARGLQSRIDALFAGDIVNASEHRAALHWALRGGGDDLSAVATMRREQAKAAAFALEAASGGLGFSLKTILHIGIGGSDLGPRLIWDALRTFGRAPDIRFCANVDPEDFSEAIAGVDPETTLVLVVSKSFRTPETASNAALARAWLVSALGETAARDHLAAVSSAPDKAKAWGADEARIFPMDEAVGGRYSVWSSVGLSLQIALGVDVWTRFLSGGAEMDTHFRDSPLQENTPARLAMMDVFAHTARGVGSRTVLAYAHRLRKLPDFLQQLEMESNGKSASDGPGGLVGRTGPVVWGSVGTLGQHSFHQLLHQGMRDTVVEFVASRDAGAGDDKRGRALLANAFAQAEGLMAGRSAAEAEAQLLGQGLEPRQARDQARHMDMPGGRESTFVMLDALGPEDLGALIALYEHRTFAAGVLWGINPFDQWGVERGKVLAEELDAAIEGARPGHRDASTQNLVLWAREGRAR
jgi:glucose-6-phosphate isomerase